MKDHLRNLVVALTVTAAGCGPAPPQSLGELALRSLAQIDGALESVR